MPKKYIRENLCYKYKDNIITSLKVDLHELWLINHACELTNTEIKNLKKCYEEALKILSAIKQKEHNEEVIKENFEIIKMLRDENKRMRETLGLKGK